MLDSRSRLALFGLAFALVLPVVGCGTQEPPKVIDTTTEVKMPVVQPVNQVEPTTPTK
jgi:hypothetical protein